MIQQLLNKKVIFLTGKGGTGKTTLAAALAIVAARQRKRTLLVEVDMTRPSVEDIFGTSLSASPSLLMERLHGVNVNFLESLRLYLTQVVGVDLLVSTILRNKVVRFFLEGTPFAREIVFLNTFYHYYEQAINSGQYDFVIVDLPSTGHALPILTVPTGMTRMFRIGPMVKRAKILQDFLSDHRRVSLSMVTLPEEMPMNETMEVFGRIQRDLPIELGPLFVNRMPIEDFSDAESSRLLELRQQLKVQSLPRLLAFLDAGEELSLASRTSRHQIERVRQEVSAPIVEIRELEEPHIEPPAFRLARILEQML